MAEIVAEDMSASALLKGQKQASENGEMRKALDEQRSWIFVRAEAL